MAQKSYILEILPNCIVRDFNCSHLAYCMQYNNSNYMHTCQRTETAYEAKHPLRNFIFNAIFHSVDSIFCLITTFPFFLFIWFKMKHAHEKFMAVICICRFPWLGCRLLFWEKGMKAISGSSECISIPPFDKCISSPPCQRKRLSEPERPPPKPLHPLHQTGRARERGRAMNI